MPRCSLPTEQTPTFDLPAAGETPWARQRLRVPREDGTLFARPSLSEAVELARRNRSALEASGVDLQGRTLRFLREWTRREVVQAAREYTSNIVGHAVPETPTELLLTAGHQPSLFHPGVWVKNFAVGALARRAGGTALNLIVDNDTLSTTRIRVPVGNRRQPRIETLPIDADRPTQPWEDAPIIDRQLFESFGDRVTELMSAWGIQPLLGEMWPDALEISASSTSLRDCLTAVRHRQERRWGLTNLELPISRLCELDPFLWFASHIFAHLPRFRDVHNGVLAKYRQVNRIRSRTHPVPELSDEPNGWLEAPFWVWNQGEHLRQRVFAKQVDREIHLSDGEETFARLPLTPDGEACCAVEALRELSSQGVRLRTRALTTTLFARLCLSDLFIHGIGGSKYDEMTDRIITRFFRLSPPSFLTLSATLHLPLAEPFDAQPDDLVRQRSVLRDIRYNSDRHLTPGGDSAADTLAAEKKSLIAQQIDPTASGLSRRQRRLRSRDNYDRYRRFQEISRRLARFATEQESLAERQLQSIRQQLDANAVLQNREYAFALFPAEKLRTFMAELPIGR